jgi:capsular polysaccharide biosynthesis protein
VFYPEDLPFKAQARLSAHAQIIAGFGESGMFTMMLAPTARIIIISSEGYNAENEHLIAAANGNEIHYIWGRADVRPQPGPVHIDVLQSNFSFISEDTRGCYGHSSPDDTGSPVRRRARE